MKRVTHLVFMIFLFPITAYAELTQEELHEILALRIEGIKHLTKTNMLIDATREQNQNTITAEEILAIDQAWRAGTSPKIEEIEHARASKYLKSLIRRMSNTYSEAFIADKQGANVAMYPRTSDYWQGDEAPFVNAYNDGKGAVFVSAPIHDDSTDVDEVKVAVPMHDGAEVIGVLIMAVKVSAIEAQRIRNLRSAK